MGAVPLRNPSVTSNDSGSSSLTMTSSRYSVAMHYHNSFLMTFADRGMVKSVHCVMPSLATHLTRKLLRNAWLHCRRLCITCLYSRHTTSLRGSTLWPGLHCLTVSAGTTQSLLQIISLACFRYLFLHSKARDQAPNSASIVSKQYLKCLLTQHGDRKLFLYLFKYCK